MNGTEPIGRAVEAIAEAQPELLATIPKDELRRHVELRCRPLKHCPTTPRRGGMTITQLAQHGGWYCTAEKKFTEPSMTITQLAQHGGWYCTAEKKFTEPTEGSVGSVFQVCASCGARGTLRWTPPTISSAESEPRPKREPKRRQHILP